MSEKTIILAIETSCDETAVAIAEGTRRILVSEVASQIHLHAPYGGVVPELASRNHNVTLRPLIESALKKAGLTVADLDAVAATAGPGLASSLLIGDTMAKAIAIAIQKPFFSINHMEGHLLSPFINDPSSDKEMGIFSDKETRRPSDNQTMRPQEPGTKNQEEGLIVSLSHCPIVSLSEELIAPNISLVVSGGHTMLVQVEAVNQYHILGSTRDDAAGEAFDKAGKMMGLPYPGGPEIDRRSSAGNPEAFSFPRSMLKSGDFHFSFSGLKTAMSHRIASLGDAWDETNQTLLNDLCASFQAAIIEVLVGKTIAAAEETKSTLITVSGGVSCNRSLRAEMAKAAAARGIQLRLASPRHSTDNAAMIAFAAACRLEAGCARDGLDQDINPNLRLV